MSIVASHLLAFFRSNLEQTLAVPFCLLFGFISASQGQWWSVFIFAFALVYTGVLLRAWKKSRQEAKPSRSTLVNRRDIQRICHDAQLLAEAQKPPPDHGVHAGMILHGENDLSFVKLDSGRLKVAFDWSIGVAPDAPKAMTFSTWAEALSWCNRHEVAWLTGTRAQDRVLQELFAEME